MLCNTVSSMLLKLCLSLDKMVDREIFKKFSINFVEQNQLLLYFYKVSFYNQNVPID